MNKKAILGDGRIITPYLLIGLAVLTVIIFGIFVYVNYDNEQPMIVNILGERNFLTRHFEGAGEGDNILVVGDDNSMGYPILTITDPLNNPIATMEIVGHTSQCLSTCYSDINITIYDDMVLPADFDTVNGAGRLKSTVFNFYLQNGDWEEVVVNDYSLECSPIVTSDLSFESCRNVINGSHTEIRWVDDWRKYNGEVMPAGNYVFRIEGKKEPSETLDWRFEWLGISKEEIGQYWAWWTSASPSAYYKFNDNTRLNDSSGNNLHLINLTASYSFATGKLDEALKMPVNIQNKIINYGNASSFLPMQNKNYTFGFWYNSSACTGGHEDVYIQVGKPSSRDWYIITYTNNNIAFINTGSTPSTMVSGVVCDGAWHRFVFSMLNSEMSMNVDGVNYANLSIDVFLNDSNSNLSMGTGAAGVTDLYVEELFFYTNYAWTQADVDYDYNGGTGRVLDTFKPIGVLLDKPELSVSNITNNFNWSITPDSFNITNWTFSIWNESGTRVHYNYSEESSIVAINRNRTVTLTGGNFNWSVTSCGELLSDSTIYCADANQTLWIDVTAPTVTIFNPENRITLPPTFILNYSIIDSNISTCWYQNLTMSNVTFPCANVTANLTTIPAPATGTEWTLHIWANDSGNLVSTASLNITTVNITTGNQTFLNKTFDGVDSGFLMQIFKSSNVTAVPTLYYNGSAATTYQELSNGLFNVSYTIPSLGSALNATHLFYWNWTMSWNGAGSQNFTSLAENKTVEVYQILMNYCINATVYFTKIVNVTFLDETSGAKMNATLDSSSWTYIPSVGFGTNKTFSFTNSSDHNYEYDFCIYPPWAPSVTVTSTIQASHSQSGTYPQRKYFIDSEVITNSTIRNVTMYLLNYNNGITSSYQVITIGNQVIPSAYVKVERTIGSSTVKIADGYTDSSGIISFFLNPNYQHTITVSKSGYSDSVNTLYPTQSIYTITMGSIGNYFYYNNTIDGVTWSKWPPSGLLTKGSYNFTWKVSSRTSMIYNCSMSIRYPNGTVVGSQVGCDSITPNYGGTISMMVNVTPMIENNLTRLYGTYSFGIENDTYLVESDANWRLYAPNTTSSYWGSLMYGINDSINLPEWGDNPDTRDFSRIVFFFIFFAIILAIFNFFTGYDTAYPGFFATYFMTVVVIFLSGVNGFTGHGYFYLEGAVTFGGDSFSSIINNWIFAAHLLGLSIIYWFTTQRRYQLG